MTFRRKDIRLVTLSTKRPNFQGSGKYNKRRITLQLHKETENILRSAKLRPFSCGFHDVENIAKYDEEYDEEHDEENIANAIFLGVHLLSA